MAIEKIDQTTPYPDGSFGDDAFTAFGKVNNNFDAQQADIEAEKQARAQADNALSTRIDGLPTNANLQAEITARTEADTALGVRIDDEATARAAAVTAEATARTNADNALSQAIAAEVTARQNEDSALSARLLGRNLLINGDMSVFQRGTLANRPNGEGYTIDRWSFASLGTGTSNWGVGTFTVSDSSPILPVPSPPRYWLGLNIAAGVDTAWLRQKIERVAVYHNGKATLSFWMRSGVAGKKVGVRIIQDFGGGTGASPAVFVEGTVFTLTTSFQKYTYTFDVPSIAGKTLGSAPSNNDCLQVLFDFASATGYGGQLAGQSGLFELTMVQFERGPVATEFDRRPDAIELALCQRYYEKSYNLSVSPGTVTREGCYNSGALTSYLLHAPVVRFSQRKRNVPAITLYNTQDGSAGQLSENAQNGLHVTNKPAGIDQVSSMSFEVYIPNGTATPGNVERFHWTADAEI